MVDTRTKQLVLLSSFSESARLLFSSDYCIYRSLLTDRRNWSQANFSRTCPSAWITEQKT